MCYGSGCPYENTGGHPDMQGECQKPRGEQCPMRDNRTLAQVLDDEKWGKEEDAQNN